MPSTTPSFYSLVYTLTDDSTHPISEIDIPCYEVNIRCLTNPVYIGDGANMEDYLNVGDVLTLPRVNLKEILIKNYAAGNNGKVVVTASVPNWLTDEKLGG
jgi:hypothetical protein